MVVTPGFLDLPNGHRNPSASDSWPCGLAFGEDTQDTRGPQPTASQQSYPQLNSSCHRAGHPVTGKMR